MKRVLGLLLILLCSSTLHARIKLPESLRLAGPLNAVRSEFGDEFFNFPAFYQGKAEPGSTFLNGWIEFQFSPPQGDIAHFVMRFEAVGTADGIAFPGGPTYSLLDNHAFHNPALISSGNLNLNTGEVTDLQVQAIFRNSVIARVTKNIRIPYGFINNYPPLALPIPLPFSDRPTVRGDAAFKTDQFGNITGFEFHGETIAPVTLFSRLGIFPPYSFGDGGRFYFVNPDGCLPGAPPQNCPTDETNPDGVLLPQAAFFHPHLDLVTDELKEIPQSPLIPPCLPGPLSTSNGLVTAGGSLYFMGGFDGVRSSPNVFVYNPRANQWGNAAPIPFPVISGQSVTVGSHIYLLGGWALTQNQPSNLIQRLDLATNRWSLRASAPLPVASGVAAAVGGKIYLIGGWTTLNNQLSLGTPVQIYDPVTDQWSLGPPAPSPIAGAAAVAVGSRIYVINGRTNGTVSNEVWIFDTVASQWAPGTPTVTPVFEAAAAYLDDRIYLIGGRNEIDGPSQRILQIFELADQSWRVALQPPIPSAASVAAVLDQKIYSAGGLIMVGLDEFPGRPTDTVQVYDPALGWSVCDSHPIFTSASVMNAATGVLGPAHLSPGSRVVIAGHHFASSVQVAPPLGFQGNLLSTDIPTSLNGISVRVDGQPAPILSVRPNLVEFQIPYSVPASSRNPRKVKLEVIKAGSPHQAPSVEIGIFPVGPGIFLYNFGELEYPGYLEGASAQARNADGTINHPSRPAQPGQTIVLRTTGLGFPFPTPENGELPSGELGQEVAFPLEAMIGGLPAEVKSVRLAELELGIYEVELVIPANAPRANNVPVEISLLGVTSNRAMISVQ